MKVLLVTLSDNADFQEALFSLYEQLRTIYDTYVIAIDTPKVPHEDSDNIRLVDCPRRPGIEKKTFDLITLGKLIRKIRRAHFDIIYFESLHVWNLAIMAATGKKTHQYHAIHEVIPHEGDRQVTGVDFMNRMICKAADMIVLRNHKYAGEMISRYGIQPERIKYLPLWRRYPGFTPPVHSGHVLFFGRINLYKGADQLLEIIRQCPEISFDVVGRTNPQTKGTVKELQNEKNVHLTNEYVSDQEMRDAFIQSDWVILPYRSASQSGVIIDAYRYSRPVIAFRVGAIEEQVENGKSGYLVDAGDTEAFAKKLKEAMALDTDTYNRMCADAYEYGSGKYSAEVGAKAFRRMIEEEYTEQK